MKYLNPLRLQQFSLYHLLLHLKILKLSFQNQIFFFYILVLAADTATVNPNGIKTLLANGLNTFFINGNPVFSNGPKRLSRNPLD